MATTASRPRTPSVVVATALLATGLTPMVAAPEIGTRAVVALSTDIALASTAVVDSLADAVAAVDDPGIAEALDLPGTAQAFDFAGLFNAELAAAQGFFNSLFSLPVTLFNDVQSVVTNLVNLDFGMAFSDAITIPQHIINYVLGLPGLVINTVFNMAVVLPGEYLFNFG